MIRLEFAITLEQGAFTLHAADQASVEVLGLFGPSGSGKTSLLEVIAGLRVPDRGRVSVDGRCLLDTDAGVQMPVHRREIGYVPQDVALFPHLDVRDNVLYGSPRSRTLPGQRPDVPHICEMLDIGRLLDREIDALSGGERQRVAIARALVSAPRILLLDEPLTAVDAGGRDRILPYLLRIRRDLHVPLVYVTHDAREMGEIADRVLRLEHGRVVAAGPPAEVLRTGTGHEPDPSTSSGSPRAESRGENPRT